jgi:RNA polymerase sigma-70 factor, ECF subfamily
VITDVPPRVRVDEDLLRLLYADHAAALLGFVTRLTGSDMALAEDIVQETLLRAWRHPEALDPARGPIRPWLYTVARRLVIDEYRAQRSRPREVGDIELVDVSAPDDIERALAGWVVADALASLSAAHREVLVETYYLGASVQEAATRLGVPAGTVKSRAYYALRELRLRLEEQGMTL